ncbi:MAG: DUF4381 domain-containing protein [Thermomonas sp.]
MSDPTLVLRDIHQPPLPSWWPPAPGWWMVFVAMLLALAAWAWWRRRQRLRRAAIARLFDDAVSAATSPAGKIAAMSEQLRRASRRIDPNADRLEGEEWLRFLDRDLPQPVFSEGAGTLLRDGGFRRDTDETEIAGLHAIARDRFLRWMGVRA